MKGEPQKNITIKTQRVKGYDQTSASCITSSEGRCSLKFTAFAPVDTVVIVTLESLDKLPNASKPHTLPAVKSSVFSNNDSVNATLTYDIEALKARRQTAVEQQKRWDLDKGPKLSEITTAEPIHISNFLTQKRNPGESKDARGKFETEEEYNDRLKQTRARLFYLDLPTNDSSKCKSEFIHTESLYKVACSLNDDGQPIATFNSRGDSLTLTNAFDKREVTRTLQNTAYMAISFFWAAEFKIDRKTAQTLDNDMAIGFIINDEISIKTYCDLCESRARQDASNRTIENLNQISESLSIITNRRRSYTSPPKNWKDDAFREGSIIEDWNHLIDGKSVASVIIFRKSDKSVLAQISPD